MKKKILSLTLAISIVLSLFAGMTFSANADTDGHYTEGYYTYTVTDGEATITRADSSISGDVTIPSTLGGYPVTSIGESAFQCSAIEGINIPDSVTSIGKFAFDCCGDLESITLPKSVSFIDYQVFSFDYITDVYYTGTVEDWCNISFYEQCSNPLVMNANLHVSGKLIKKLVIPDTITEIKEFAFTGCSITEVTLPKSIKSVGASAFASCQQLTSVILSNAEITIGKESFEYCNELSDIYFSGTKQQRSTITIGKRNDKFENATWHYNSSGPETIKNYPDVNYKDWYGLSVEYVVNAGLMKGYANGKFGTADGIQRQDFVVILARLSGDDIDSYAGKSSFKDVPTNAYYAAALAWAKANSVSSGYNDGSFGVGDKVTREQIMTFLYNYAKLKGYDVTVTDGEKAQIRAQYSDFVSVSSYAQEATYWALKNGVISGKQINGKRYISPGSPAQRCEVAAMFYNINENRIFAE